LLTSFSMNDLGWADKIIKGDLFIAARSV
jgi:hypothetical protein